MRYVLSGLLVTALFAACARTEDSDHTVVGAQHFLAGGEVASILADVTPAGISSRFGRTPRQVVQGSVTGINEARTLVSLLVELVWWPEVRADRRPMDVSVDRATRFVPIPSDVTNLAIGDEVQVRVHHRGSATGRATEITILDVD